MVIKSFSVPTSNEWGLLCELNKIDIYFNINNPFYIYLNLVKKDEAPGPSLLLKVVPEIFNTTKIISVSSSEQLALPFSLNEYIQGSIYHIENNNFVTNIIENTYKIIPGTILKIKDNLLSSEIYAIYLGNGLIKVDDIILNTDNTFSITAYYKYDFYSVAYLLDKYWFYNIGHYEIDNAFYPDLIQQPEAFITSLNPIAVSKFIHYNWILQANNQQIDRSDTRFFLYSLTQTYNQTKIRNMYLFIDYNFNSDGITFRTIGLDNYFEDDEDEIVRNNLATISSGFYPVNIPDITQNYFLMFHIDNNRLNNIIIRLYPFSSNLSILQKYEEGEEISSGQKLFYYQVNFTKDNSSKFIPEFIGYYKDNNNNKKYITLNPSYKIISNSGLDLITSLPSSYSWFIGFVLGKVNKKSFLNRNANITLFPVEIYEMFFKDPNTLLVNIEPNLELKDITDIISSSSGVIYDNQIGGRLCAIFGYDETGKTLIPVPVRTDRLKKYKRIEYVLPDNVGFTAFYGLIDTITNSVQNMVDNSLNANPFQEIVVNPYPIVCAIIVSNSPQYITSAKNKLVDLNTNNIISKVLTTEKIIKSTISDTDFFEIFLFYIPSNIATAIDLKKHLDLPIKSNSFITVFTLMV
ncbi:MAG: hypothetical protein ACO2O4_01155 [Minisyncoccia bacterium]